MHIRVGQDPYIKLTLHDGMFDQGGKHQGESVKTTVKNNAGGNAVYNETYRLTKPGQGRVVEFVVFGTCDDLYCFPETMHALRVELWDSDALSDDLLGW